MRAEEILKENNIRKTTGRMSILNFLIKVGSPVSIKNIKKGIESSMDLTTVYRNLEKFVEAGIIYKTNFGDVESYFEYQKNHHHHIACNSCGKKEEISVCLGKSFKDIEKNLKGFSKISNHMIELFGTCKSCSK